MPERTDKENDRKQGKLEAWLQENEERWNVKMQVQVGGCLATRLPGGNVGASLTSTVDATKPNGWPCQHLVEPEPLHKAAEGALQRANGCSRDMGKDYRTVARYLHL